MNTCVVLDLGWSRTLDVFISDLKQEASDTV